MPDAPSFSVVTPAYNAADTLEETVASVRAQTFDDWELVIVDDGSTDDTRALAEGLAAGDSRIRVIHQENRGTGGAYNTGVRATRAAWVLICSADDILLPEHLELAAESIARHADCDIISFNGYYWDPDGQRRLVYSTKRATAERHWTLEDTIDRCFFSVGACYRQSVFDLIGGYQEDIFGEDYDFWLRALAAGARHVYVPHASVLHRISPNQKTAGRVRAYESDIESISRVAESHSLSQSEERAAEKAIRHRRRLIAELASPDSVKVRLRRWARGILTRVKRS